LKTAIRKHYFNNFATQIQGIMTIKRILFVLISLSIVFTSCQKNEEKQVKYAFLFIGDGMGVAQVNLTEAYLAAIKNKKGFEQLSFTQLPEAGLVKTYANNRFITCSAAAATAFATGNKTNINRISTDSTGNVPFKSIATICKENGMKVGILTSVSIDHATPAVFYAHEKSRNSYFQIGLDLANSDFDYFGGGGFKVPIDTLNGELINSIELAKENGFTYVDSREGFTNLKKGNEKVIAVHPELMQGSAAIPYVIDNPVGPTLADFTAKGIELLENENGFFMMIEGGKIDWACHSDDAASAIQETIAFDEAIQVALDFYKKHPDETLIIVTADHETGGLALGAEKTGYESYFEFLQYQKVSIDKFSSLLADFEKTLSGNYDTDLNNFLAMVSENFGLGKEIPLTEEDKSKLWFAFEKTIKNKNAGATMYSNFPPISEVIVKMVSEKAGVGWTTYAHTGINVPIYAIGPGAELFSGVIDNTDIPKIMMKQLGVE
jgi:alkaline phosphatase